MSYKFNRNSVLILLQGDSNSVQISVQLKLSNKVKNSFEYCEVHLPFFHRLVMLNCSSPTVLNSTCTCNFNAAVRLLFEHQYNYTVTCLGVTALFPLS